MHDDEEEKEVDLGGDADLESGDDLGEGFEEEEEDEDDDN